MNNKQLIFLVLILLLSGCKSKKVATVESGSAKAHNEFFILMQEQAFQYETLTARSRVDLKMIKDSAFQLSVQPFLGIEIFRMELTVDSVKILDRMNKRYMADNYSNLKEQTPIEFNFYNLQSLFTNQLFLPGHQKIQPKQYRLFELKQEGSYAEIFVKDALGLLYAFVADGEEKILSTHITDPSDKYALNWDYSDFRLTEGQPFPMRMDVKVLDKGESKGGVSLYFSRLQTNVPVNMEFSVPAKYQRITLDQILKSLGNIKM